MPATRGSYNNWTDLLVRAIRAEHKATGGGKAVQNGQGQHECVQEDQVRDDGVRDDGV